ncbi:MAG: hypothetical protein M0033_07030 [Nitrospiraceae bacterium]|nr:hypothetical protein [Nitrospiraceae bacterium]
MKKWWKLWAPLALLVILTPLGLWIPGLFGAGGAWGEWEAAELKKIIGYVPRGMKGLGGLWHAPAANYGIGGLPDGLGYVASAVMGVAVIVIAGFAIGRVLSKDGRKRKDQR